MSVTLASDYLDTIMAQSDRIAALEAENAALKAELGRLHPYAEMERMIGELQQASWYLGLEDFMHLDSSIVWTILCRHDDYDDVGVVGTTIPEAVKAAYEEVVTDE